MFKKSIILPILTVLALGAQSIFGVKIPDDVINQAAVEIANVGMLAVTIYGIIKDYKKQK